MRLAVYMMGQWTVKFYQCIFTENHVTRGFTIPKYAVAPNPSTENLMLYNTMLSYNSSYQYV